MKFTTILYLAISTLTIGVMAEPRPVDLGNGVRVRPRDCGNCVKFCMGDCSEICCGFPPRNVMKKKGLYQLNMQNRKGWN